MKSWRIISAVLFASLFGVIQAQACPVCFQSGGEERWAFYATTAFLTTLPLLAVGTAVYLLYKRSQSLNTEEVS
jgi:hypothetical protein